jgi:putative DNA primase/helicase
MVITLLHRLTIYERNVFGYSAPKIEQNRGSGTSLTTMKETKKRNRGRTPKRTKDAKRCGAKQKCDAAAIVACVVQPQIERGNLELFRTPNRVAYATVKVNQQFETYPLESDEFKDLLSHAIYSSMGLMPTDALLKNATRQLRGEALYGKNPVERVIFHRIAEAGGNLYLDLCDREWRVVEITPTGWQVAKDAPVRFVRSSVSRPLPELTPGGNLNEIFSFVHITRRVHRVLFLSWLVGALQTQAAYPILILCGSQGAAKTTACRIATGLIDPAEPQLVSGYSSERDLLVDATHSHVIGIDNVSEIDDRLSDALCRLATGSGMRRRKLYSDSNLFAVTVKKPVTMNAITQTATRGDLLDRMITLRLDPIPEGERREEAKLLAEFKDRRPALLGALLTAVSAALRRHSQLDVVNLHLPRMADFSTWVIACERELGFTDGEFLKAYTRNRQEASDATLEFSTIGLPIIRLVDAGGGSWEGSVKKLFADLNAKADDPDRRDPEWPKSEKALASALNRIDANLHAIGYGVRWLRRDSRTRRRIVRIEGKSRRTVVEFQTDAGNSRPAALASVSD